MSVAIFCLYLRGRCAAGEFMFLLAVVVVVVVSSSFGRFYRDDSPSSMLRLSGEKAYRGSTSVLQPDVTRPQRASTTVTVMTITTPQLSSEVGDFFEVLAVVHFLILQSPQSSYFPFSRVDKN